MKTCESCGKQNHDRAKFCTGCGKSLAGVSAPSKSPSPITAPPGESNLPPVEPSRPVAAPRPTPMRAPKPSSMGAGPIASSAPTMFADNNLAPVPAPRRTPAPRPQPAPSTPAFQDDANESSAPTMFSPTPMSPTPSGANKPGLVVRTNTGGLRVAPVVRPTAMPRNNPAAETMPATEAPPSAFPRPHDPNSSGRFPMSESAPHSPHNPRMGGMATLPAEEDEPEPMTIAAAQPVVVARPGPAEDLPPLSEAPPSACPRCSTPIPAGYIFCGRCGFDMRTYSPPAPEPFPEQEDPTPLPQTGPVPHLLLLTPDGQEQARYPLAYGELVVGRDAQAEISCPENIFLSERHSAFAWDGQQLLLRDLGSMNGTFVKIREEAPLQSGDYLCIGQQFLRFEVSEIIPSPSQAPDGTYRHGSPLPEISARLVLIGMGGLEFDTYYLRNEETLIGRVSGDIIFARDNFISRTHAKITAQDESFTVSDMGSSNGTFLQIQEESSLRDGDLLLMGDQLFRIELPK